MKTLKHGTKTLHIKRLKKGTLLFRIVKDNEDDLKGFLLPDGTRCLNANYNVFFYPNPFTHTLALTDDKITSDMMSVYVLKHDINVLNLTLPSNLTRAIRGAPKNAFVTTCSSLKQGCSPYPGRSWDPCFSRQFAKKHPSIVGMLSVARQDAERFTSSVSHMSNDVKHYIHVMEDAKGRIAVPEIMLYPLPKRSVDDIVTKPTDKLNNSYKLLGHIPHKNTETLLRFMRERTVFDPTSSFYLYKE